jgi:GT2 family glycosyltransferase
MVRRLPELNGNRQMNGSEDIPHFSVVIPTYERNDLLARCLECLAPGRQEGMELVEPLRTRKVENTQEQGQTHSTSYEVIVSDDGRSTTAEAMIRDRFPWARWVPGPGIGPGGNRNSGVALSRGDWLVFTDDDCLPSSGWLIAYLTSITQNPTQDVFEGDTRPDRFRQTLAEHAPVDGGGGNLWSCNFAIRQSTFRELGGFDSRFRVCMEDSDFALRVRKSGRTFPFLENALVIHPWRPRKLNRDGWKSNKDEMADHLRFRQKHADTSGITMARVFLLALRIFWRDLCFVWKQGDWRGIAYAIASFWHTTRIALHCATSRQ